MPIRTALLTISREPSVFDGEEAASAPASRLIIGVQEVMSLTVVLPADDSVQAHVFHAAEDVVLDVGGWWPSAGG